MLLNSAGGKDEIDLFYLYFIEKNNYVYITQEAKMISLSDNFSLEVNSDDFSDFNP